MASESLIATERFFCDVGAERLECLRLTGKAESGPVLVFLHEGLGCAAGWRDFPARMVETTGLSALVYSRAGYGGSSPVTLPRPVSYLHDEALRTLPALLDQLGLDDVILFGHSDGASIALIHAGVRHDARIRALVVEAPHVMMEALTIASIRLLDEQFRSGTLRERLARQQGDNVDVAFRGFVDTWLNPVNAGSWDLIADVAGVRAPVLLIQGRDDQYGTSRQVSRIVEAVGGPIEACLIAGCGHHPHREHPDWVLGRAGRFVAEVLGV